jgi:tetratricopeptide (TPR) repeat protein
MYASKLLRPREKSVYAPKVVDLSLYLAHEFEHELGGEEAPTAREYFAKEEQNIRAALLLVHQYRSTPEEISKQAILTYYLVRIYMFSDRCADAIAIADTVLETTPLPKDSGDRAHILFARGVAKRRIGDPDGAETDIQNAVVTFEMIDDKDSKDSMATCFTELSHLKMALEDFDSALWYSEAARIIFEEVGNSIGQANAILQRAQGRWFKNDLPGAETDYRTSLNIYRAENDLRGQANVLVALADLILVTDKFETAEPELDAALSIYRKLGETHGEVHVLCLRANLRSLQNRPNRSEEDWDAAITICDNIGYRLGKAHALLDRGTLRISLGDRGGITDLRDSIVLYDNAEQPSKRAESRIRLAVALANQGEKEQALELLFEARRISVELGHKPFIRECERLISEITH